MFRALVLHNADFPGVARDQRGGTFRARRDSEEDVGRAARESVVSVARAVADALVSLGTRVQLRGVRQVADVVAAVRQYSPDVVVNLCESLGADARYEATVAAVLERLGVAFTGASSRTLRLCLDKQACNDALVRAGIDAPPSVVARCAADVPPRFGFPLIVKPNGEDGSTGITAESVVGDARELARALERVRAALGGEAVVQRYVAGREINVSLLGSSGGEAVSVLPLAEIDFGAMPEGKPHIVSYASKWDEASDEWRGTRVVPAAIDAPLERRIAHVARRVAVALGLDGYARIDLRLEVDERGARPFVVDVNPNCDLAPDAGFAAAATRGGLGYRAMVAALVETALARQERERAAWARLGNACRVAAVAQLSRARRRPAALGASQP